MKPARSNVYSLPQEQEPAANQAHTTVQGQGRKRRFKLRKWLLVGFTAWAAYVFFFVQSPDLNRLEEEQQKLNAEIKQMEETNQGIQKNIDQLNDPAYIAELARKKYMMVKDGETLFVQPKP